LAVSWTILNISIRDFLRLRWCGLLLDVSRNCFPLPVVRSVVASLSRSKLKVLHLHLIDHRGWRFEGERFTLLTQIELRRSSSQQKWHRDLLDVPPCGPFFFMQDEVRDLIAFARDREVEIVPEVEMPGHSAAYPQGSYRGNAQEPLTY
jgi:hexosaminidase